MPKLILTIAIFILPLIFSSCGKKGKLYLPEDVSKIATQDEEKK